MSIVFFLHTDPTVVLQHWGFYQDAVNYITNTKGAYAILDP
jgi:hypothetical protein